MSRTRGTFEDAPNLSLTCVQVEHPTALSLPAPPPTSMAVVVLPENIYLHTFSLPFSSLNFFYMSGHLWEWKQLLGQMGPIFNNQTHLFQSCTADRKNPGMSLPPQLSPHPPAPEM